MSFTRSINQRSFVTAYRHNGHAYEHNIFCTDDDRVECIDRQGKVILTFTSDCYVLTGGKEDTDRQQVGTLHMWGNEGWFFRPEGEPNRKVPLNVQNILVGEVTVAKMFLDGEFPVKPKAKEGA